MFRLTSFLDRVPTLSHEEFIEYWWREHSPLAARLPGLRRYSTVRPRSPETTPYGVAELYFDTREAFDRALGPSADTDAIADVPNFIDSTTRYHLEDTVRIQNPDEPARQQLEESIPVIDQDGFPITEYVGLRRRDGVDKDTFSETLRSTIDRERENTLLRSLTVDEPTSDNDRETLDVLLKRTVNPGSLDEVSPVGERYDSLLDLAETTVKFVGHERVVVDEL